jgi:hypothetical protein
LTIAHFKDEAWLQQLLFEHPELIPFEELDPLFRGSIPLAREVESGSGPIDLVFGNADGLLTLVETKLWRNPGSRREVVAQLINYAAELTHMSYGDLGAAIAQADDAADDCLIQKMRSRLKGFDERHFHDALSRNLKQGRFLLLIIGDGIREDVDSMAEFLHRHPALGFTLRLVEMAMYRLDPASNEEIIVLPQIIAKTSEVLRAVVEIRGDRLVVETPAEIPPSSGSRYKMTPEQFFAELSKEESAETVRALKTTIENASAHGLGVQWMQGGPVFKFIHESGDFFTFGQFYRDGDLRELFRLPVRCKELSLPNQIWVDYFDAVVALIPGATRKHGRYSTGKEWDDVVGPDEEYISLAMLLSRKDEWFKAVDLAIAKIREALSASAKTKLTTSRKSD